MAVSVDTQVDRVINLSYPNQEIYKKIKLQVLDVQSLYKVTALGNTLLCTPECMLMTDVGPQKVSRLTGRVLLREYNTPIHFDVRNLSFVIVADLKDEVYTEAKVERVLPGLVMKVLTPGSVCNGFVVC